MEMEYESISATTCKDMIALKATEEPILMSERSMVMKQESATAFAGICFVGCTVEIHFEKGRPLSLANAKVCLDVEALKLMFETMTMRRRRMVRALSPDVETDWRKTQIKG